MSIPTRGIFWCLFCKKRKATTSNRPLMVKSHPDGMLICYAIFAGISLRLCSISLRSLRITFAAYLSTHIKSLRDYFNHHYMITGTTCISFHIFSDLGRKKVGVGLVEWGRIATFVFHIQNKHFSNLNNYAQQNDSRRSARH